MSRVERIGAAAALLVGIASCQGYAEFSVGPTSGATPKRGGVPAQEQPEEPPTVDETPEGPIEEDEPATVTTDSEQPAGGDAPGPASSTSAGVSTSSGSTASAGASTGTASTAGAGAPTGGSGKPKPDPDADVWLELADGPPMDDLQPSSGLPRKTKKPKSGYINTVFTNQSKGIVTVTKVLANTLQKKSAQFEVRSKPCGTIKPGGKCEVQVGVTYCNGTYRGELVVQLRGAPKAEYKMQLCKGGKCKGHVLGKETLSGNACKPARSAAASGGSHRRPPPRKRNPAPRPSGGTVAR